MGSIGSEEQPREVAASEEGSSESSGPVEKAVGNEGGLRKEKNNDVVK
jgi:hypothetical protein